MKLECRANRYNFVPLNVGLIDSILFLSWFQIAQIRFFSGVFFICLIPLTHCSGFPHIRCRFNNNKNLILIFFRKPINHFKKKTFAFFTAQSDQNRPQTTALICNRKKKYDPVKFSLLRWGIQISYQQQHISLSRSFLLQTLFNWESFTIHVIGCTYIFAILPLHLPCKVRFASRSDRTSLGAPLHIL